MNKFMRTIITSKLKSRLNKVNTRYISSKKHCINAKIPVFIELGIGDLEHGMFSGRLDSFIRTRTTNQGLTLPYFCCIFMQIKYFSEDNGIFEEPKKTAAGGDWVFILLSSLKIETSKHCTEFLSILCITN